MKAQIQTLGIAVLILLQSSAFAEPLGQKEPVRIDFNKMIDSNANDKADLEKSVGHQADTSPLTTTTQVQADKKKVLDFIDVEVNLGKERPIVDRRFNSEGEVRLAPEFSVTK